MTGVKEEGLPRLPWTRAAVILSIEEWAYQHDGVPPKAREAIGDLLPSVGSVVKVFGTWNAAVKAAGFAPHRRGGGRIPLKKR